MFHVMKTLMTLTVVLLLAALVPAHASASRSEGVSRVASLSHKVHHLKKQNRHLRRMVVSLRYNFWTFYYATNCELSKISGPPEDVDYWCNGDSIYSIPTPDPPPPN